MQPFSTPADTRLTSLRPDTPDTARTPARAAGSAPDGRPFDAVFHASPERPGRSAPVDPATVQTAKAADDTDAEAGDGKEETRVSESAVEDTPKDDNAARPSTQENSPSTEDLSFEASPSDMTDADDQTVAMLLPDQAEQRGIEAAGRSQSGHDIENALEDGAVAASVETGGNRISPGKSAPDAAPPLRGVASDRLPPAQPLAASRPDISNPASGTAEAASLSFAWDIGGPRTARGAETAGGRVPMMRGREDTRLTSPTGAPVLANTVTSPVIYGPGVDAMHPKTAVSTAGSSFFADGAGIDGADTGRDPDAPLGLDSRGTNATGTSFASLTSLPRSDLPQTIAMQIAAAIQRGTPGTKSGIELMLSPEELGPVRLTFTHSESGVTVNVQADRAETLELLRRNIDSLAQEFLDIGYESAEFTFDRRDAEAPPPARGVSMDDAEGTPGIIRGAPDSISSVLLVSDRLDIRL